MIAILAQILISVLLLLVLLKIVWNVALPYGLLRMRVQRPVSLFPLIELVPLAVAIFIAWCGDISGWLSAGSIIKSLGFAVLFSYAHFAFIAILVGIAMHRGGKGDRSI